MSTTLDERRELLPTINDDSNRRCSISDLSKRPSKGGYGVRLMRGTLRRHTALTLLLSFTCLTLAASLFTYDFIRLRTAIPAVRSYSKFLDNIWPVGLPNRTDIWGNENSKSMRALMSCMVEDSCNKNQTSIVMLSSYHFAFAISGSTSGEDIWAASVLQSVREMGYTPIFTTNNEELASTYSQFPDLVKIIIVESDRSEACFKDSKCIKSTEHPLGVPAWKMFSFHFWRGAAHPLGNDWTLSPENYRVLSPDNSKDNFYLGYSIERTCTQVPLVPLDDRPNQAYLLAKQSRYFFKDYAWPGLEFDLAPFDIDLVVGIASYDNGHEALPAGIIDLGRLNKTMFQDHLSNSRALIGIGNPLLSPSPYDALCMGVPFINPILNWDRDDPDNREKWDTQQDGVKFLDPPYVYNVRKGDSEGFWDALFEAVDAPIGRYIKPEMTMDALKSRVSKLIETNWREKAEVLLEERIAEGSRDLFYL